MDCRRHRNNNMFHIELSSLSTETSKMAVKSMLKKLTLAENVFGVFRNYLEFGRYKRVLIILRVFVELLLAIVYYAFRICEVLQGAFLTEDTMINVTNLTLTLIVNIYALVSAIVYAKHYTRYFNEMSVLQKYVKNGISDMCEATIVKRLYRVISVCFGVFFIIAIFGIPNIGAKTKKQYVYIVTGTLLETRMLCQNVQTIGSVTIISGYLQCITESVFGSVTALQQVSAIEKDDVKTNNMRKVCYYNIDRRMKTWVVMFEHLHKMNINLNKTFGGQILLNIFYCIVYLTILAYRFATNFLKESGFYTSEWTLIFMVTHFAEIYLTASEGQRVQNEAKKLRRYLARLHMALINAPCAPGPLVKFAGNFWQSSTVELMAVQLPFAYHLGMPLLLAFVAATTEYVMIGLQASHVV